jgi:hypothetical protein
MSNATIKLGLKFKFVFSHKSRDLLRVGSNNFEAKNHEVVQARPQQSRDLWLILRLPCNCGTTSTTSTTSTTTTTTATPNDNEND